MVILVSVQHSSLNFFDVSVRMILKGIEKHETCIYVNISTKYSFIYGDITSKRFQYHFDSTTVSCLPWFWTTAVLMKLALLRFFFLKVPNWERTFGCLSEINFHVHKTVPLEFSFDARLCHPSVSVLGSVMNPNNFHAVVNGSIPRPPTVHHSRDQLYPAST